MCLLCMLLSLGWELDPGKEASCKWWKFSGPHKSGEQTKEAPRVWSRSECQWNENSKHCSGLYCTHAIYPLMVHPFVLYSMHTCSHWIIASVKCENNAGISPAVVGFKTSCDYIPHVWEWKDTIRFPPTLRLVISWVGEAFPNNPLSSSCAMDVLPLLWGYHPGSCV